MDHNILNKLESKIEDLIFACDTLQQENNELRTKCAVLSQEKNQLGERNKNAVEHNREVVHKIKAIAE
jgi:uncharacterized protein (TIGR02449 family)